MSARPAPASRSIDALTAYPGGGVRDLVMDPQDIRRVYVVNEQSRVWASYDAGATWRNLTGNLPKLLGEARTVELYRPSTSGRTVLLVGGLGGAFQLCEPCETGALWSRLASELPHGLVLDLRYNYKANVLVAGVLGRGAWTLSNYFGTGSHSTWQSAAAAAGSAAAVTLPADLPKAAPRLRTNAAQAAVPPKQ